MRPPGSVVNFFMQMQPNPTIAVETNGRGVTGFIIDLPGGFVRGKGEAEAISGANLEVSRYLAWIGLDSRAAKGTGVSRGFVLQRQVSASSVDEGDTMILLDADRRKMRPDEFRALTDLVLYSGETFDDLYRGAKMKDWTDQSRVRPTFYGQTPCSIEQIYSHVRKTQSYYLSRLGLSLQDGDFMMMRRLALNSLRKEFEEHGNRTPIGIDGEMWTLKKVLRRFLWHDRIHAKAISHIMRKQEQLGLLTSGHPPADPFHFSGLS